MRRTGWPRGQPRTDDEQANACAGGCDASGARVGREDNPGPTMSRRTPAQEGATHASHGLAVRTTLDRR
ncbi:MAG: hypothetical protein JWO52_6036 [Gammaproteobacteria bacterium]|jgi:hypothetical protein|nr:hypothetical protein [Gammaproteobacteria bacterium]